MAMRSVGRAVFHRSAQQGPNLVPYDRSKLRAPVLENGGGQAKPAKDIIDKSFGHFQGGD